MKMGNPELIEGPEAFRQFDALVGALVAVPRSEILRREAEYKKKAALNPNKRGPKPKPSASPFPDVAPRV